jgi:hypothetical protein
MLPSAILLGSAARSPDAPPRHDARCFRRALQLHERGIQAIGRSAAAVMP